MNVDAADVVLLVLGAPTGDVAGDGRVDGITRLEKLVFLIDQESRFRALAKQAVDPLHFKPYHFGPYTQEVYDAISFLVGIRLINESRRRTSSSLDLAEEVEELDERDGGLFDSNESAPYVERSFGLTPKGRYVADTLAERVGSGAAEQIAEIKARYGSMPLKQLLRYVYREYPEMTTRSRIKDKL